MTTRKAASAALATELTSEDFMFVTALGETFKLRKKFKRLKFLRLITEDPAAALALVFADGEYERLEEMDMSEDEFMNVIERVSEVLTGGSKN